MNKFKVKFSQFMQLLGLKTILYKELLKLYFPLF